MAGDKKRGEGTLDNELLAAKEVTTVINNATKNNTDGLDDEQKVRDDDNDQPETKVRECVLRLYTCF